jgi:hypothetical protein
MLLLTGCTVSGPGSFDAAKDSVVFILTTYGNGPVQYIVTNAHCVFTDDGQKGSVQVYFSVAANNFMMAEILWWDFNKDLAVLRLPNPTTERKAAILSPENKTDITGDFWALGYPAATDYADDFRAFDKAHIAQTRGGIQRKTRVGNRDVYLLDLMIHGGNSGGPLVNAKGEVVGVNTFGITDPQSGVEALYAVTINELIRGIDRQDIPFAVVGDLNIVMVILLTGVILVALVLTAVLYLTLGKKKAPASAAPRVIQSATPVAPAAVPAGHSVKAYIKAVNGNFAGRNFEVGGKIIIGRDGSKCTVAFPVEAAGISGIHCEVTFDGSTAYLRDLGSSYGTFLANGTKLAEKAPMRLNNGDRFYVATVENTFEFSIM